jgi:hypothetical protein
MQYIAGRKATGRSDAPQGNNMSAIFHLCYLIEIFPSLILEWKCPAFTQTRIVSADLIPPYLNV